MKKNIKIRCIKGIPCNTEVKINNKILTNYAILRYKETSKEKKLIIVTFDANGKEHQEIFEENFDFVLYSPKKIIKIVVKNNKTTVYYKSKKLSNITSILWEVEVPDISSIELQWGQD